MNMLLNFVVVSIRIYEALSVYYWVLLKINLKFSPLQQSRCNRSEYPPIGENRANKRV